MIKIKLIKAFAIGLCMSALYTGLAFAQSVDGVAPVSEAQPAVDTKLIEKQNEINQYVFEDHVRDFEAKGFKVVYTGIIDSYVEIGISPFSDDAANYLYDVFGKDTVKVIKGEEVMMYTTDLAPDAAATGVAVDPVEPNASVSSDDAVKRSDADIPVDDGRVYKGEVQAETGVDTVIDKEVQLEDPSVIYQTTAVGAPEEAQDISVVSVQDNVAVRDLAEKSEGISTPVMILMIIGGVLVIGSTVIIIGKRKAMR